MATESERWEELLRKVGRQEPICRHKDRDSAMSCPLYRPEKSEQVGGYHGANHFEEQPA